jgi:type I restriction enzyme M protein
MPNNDTQQIVNKAWNFAHVLRDDGLSYMAYTEQITFLLFLKMADEQTKPPYNKPPIVPAKFSWESLLKREGDELEAHYRHCLEELGKQPGMLGEIFKKARPEIQNPATLRRLIVDLIDVEKWSSMQADVKGDIYEGLLAKSAAESPKGAGQYFTPRELIKAIVDCVQPTADDVVCDPAAGTGGFLLAAYDYVARHQGKTLDKDQKRHLRTKFVKGWELVPNTARLCIMNLYLHGIDADPCPIKSGVDSLANDPGDRFSVVLTNPPFGKKGSIAIVNEVGELEKEDTSYERQDFWTTTKNKQLNFVQHVRTPLKVNGRCAIVVPDNVLFEGGAGETVRRNLLKQCDVHTLLRLPTGIFIRPGREGQRPVPRCQAGPGETLDQNALGLRPADEHALHTEDEPAPTGRFGRVRGMLPPRQATPSQTIVERENPRRPLAFIRLRRGDETGQSEPRYLLAQRQELGGFRRPAHSRRARPGNRRRSANSPGAIHGDRGEGEELKTGC